MNRFLRNRSLNVKVVNDKDGTPVDPNADPFEGVEVAAAYAEVAKDFITHTVVTIGIAFAGYKILERLCR